MNFIPLKVSILYIRGDQEGLFELVTLDRILNRITGVTSGCWWLVVVNAIPIRHSRSFWDRVGYDFFFSCWTN
jgi:hypothetical protein